MTQFPVSANSTSPSEAFARLLCDFRVRAGLSQGQLAHAARLSRTYIYHLERGQRANPSPHAARQLARALELQGADKRLFYTAVHVLTGVPLDADDERADLLDLAHLARLLVANSSYPTHVLDRLWHLTCWNNAVVQLFAVDEVMQPGSTPHLLALVFDPQRRALFRPWDPLARRLIADFKHSTATLTHLPAYKALWRELRALPDFRRIEEVTAASPGVEPSFTLTVQHAELGTLALRTASTLFSGVRDHNIVSYLPEDERTLELFRQKGWQRSDA